MERSGVAVMGWACVALGCSREPAPPVASSASASPIPSLTQTPALPPAPHSVESREAARSLDGAREALAPEARAAFEKLRGATVFESEKTGASGSISPNAEALRTLIRDPKAPGAFQALFDHATPVARIYAVTAFWYLRPADFASLAEKLRRDFGAHEVQAQDGSIGRTKTVSRILEAVPDAVQAKPGSSAYDLLCNVPAEFSADFPGGYTPISIVEGTVIHDKRCANKPPLPEYLKAR